MLVNTDASADLELDAALCRLIEDLTERIKLGEQIDFDAVLTKYPQHSETLRQILPSLELFAEVGASAAREALAPAPEHGDEHVPGPPQPDYGVLGDFRILREIGRGGMGVVYEAEQISLERRVAVKVLPFAGVLDEQRLLRFKNEARAAAGLSHPRIVPIYAVGSDRGIHYYAMQYIEGQTLADVIRDISAQASGGRAPIRRELVPPGAFAVDFGTAVSRPVEAIERPGEMTNDEIQMSKEIRNPRVKNDRAEIRNDLARFRTIAEWGVQIADALDYAHSVGVIHRDIKPGNLMLDKDGGVWITDFGLAQIETDAGLTMTGDIVGTLRYMSPEQSLGKHGLVDQRSDVYSLGLALYELLTLKPAFGEDNRRALLNRIAVDDPIPARRINPAIPVELETIVQKATEREPEARYATARDLADDLRRYLQEQPIRARPATPLERLRKWSRRNRSVVRAGTVFALLAGISLAAGVVLVDHAQQQIRLEQQARAADQKLSAAAREVSRVNSYVTDINLARRAWDSGDFTSARRLLQNWLPKEGERDLRSFEWRYLLWMTREMESEFVGHRGEVYCVRVAPGGKLMATAGQDGLRIWDVMSAAEIIHLTDHAGDVNCVAFSPDGSLMATAGDDLTAKIWNTQDWRVCHTIPHGGHVVAVAFTPDGKLLATGERHFGNSPNRVGNDFVRLWDVETWDSRGACVRHNDRLESLAISDDGTLLATGTSPGSVYVWDLVAGRVRLDRQNFSRGISQLAGVQCVAFAHRRPLLASADDDGIVRLWRTTDAELLATLAEADAPLKGVAFAPDDSAIAAVGDDRQVHFWQANSEGIYVCAEATRGRSEHWSLAFLDEKTVLTTGRDGAVGRWAASQYQNRLFLPMARGMLSDLAFAPDGRFLVVAARALLLVDTSNRMTCTELAPPSAGIGRIAVAPRDGLLFSCDDSAKVAVRQIGTWETLNEFQVRPKPIMEFSSRQNGIVIRHPGDPSEMECFDPLHGGVVPLQHGLQAGDDVAFSAEFPISVVFRHGGDMELWNGERQIWQARNPGVGQQDCAFSPDGRLFAAPAGDGTIHIWSTREDVPGFRFVGDVPMVGKLTFSPDGRTLAGATRKGRVKLWNAATGHELLAFESGLQPLSKIAFSPNGLELMAAGWGISTEMEVVIWQCGLAETASESAKSD